MRNIVLILTLILSVSHPSAAQDGDDAYLDSLAELYYSLKDLDTTKLRICDEIAAKHYNVDSTFAWAKRQIKLAQLQHNAFYEAKALVFNSWAYYYIDEYAKANECNFRAIIILDSIGDQALKARNYLMLGDNYHYLNDFKQSTYNYNVALQIFEEIQDSAMIAACYRSLAQSYFMQKLYSPAEEYFQHAIDIDSTTQEYDYLLTDYQGLALMYLTKYLYNNAKPDTSLITKAKQTINKTNDIPSDYEYGIYTALETKSNILFYEATIHGYQGKRLQSLLDTMRMCHEQGSEIVRKLQNSDTICFEICRANYYTLSKQFSNAKTLLDSLIKASDEQKINAENADRLYLACDNYYTAIHDYKTAYYYKSRFYEIINSQTSIDYAVMAAQDIAQAKFDEEIRHRQEQEAKKTRITIYFAIAFILILTLITIESIRSRRHNRALNAKNEKISIQNQRIKASINYASLIQHAAMPDKAQINNLFAEHFIIYRPLDIVAGDFYWINSAGKYKMAVCADSTGHGVPGAFVSILGISLLNDLAPTALSNGGSASSILNEMRNRLMYSLGQDKSKFGSESQMNTDGIDLALAIIDTETNTLHYAGAYRPLWIYSQGTLTAIKPDKMPIGIYAGALKPFTEHTTPIHKGDTLYMFTDGIPDQFGYTDESKTDYKNFSVKQLFNLIGSIAPLPFSEQRDAITSAIDSWQNGYLQLDDITFFALKL